MTTYSEQFLENEERGHAIDQRTESEGRFHEHRGLGDYHIHHARIVRAIARRQAARNIRLIRERYER